MVIADRLRRAREQAGFDNASEFARRCGLAPNSVYRYERGDLVPRLAVAKRWASLTGVTLDWLAGDEPAATGTEG